MNGGQRFAAATRKGQVPVHGGKPSGVLYAGNAGVARDNAPDGHAKQAARLQCRGPIKGINVRPNPPFMPTR